ncbi:chromatin-remodeling ATPase INO80-like isoform X1 [Papaver somniferum]|uniref:chromatin-remodeling ATPase INO80-like isoform X1 n=2 Tax=Papaver somniferum TaxID=3469 RepID=UPI000E6FE1C1|nr:chromatin-remodeling ATPase INO80-like isoform X1 [Papaver somniferum]
MEYKRSSKEELTFSNLFNLESLMNFQLPQQDDDFDNNGNSSQSESRGSQGRRAMTDHSNGSLTRKTTNKRRHIEGEAGSNSSSKRESDSNDEDNGSGNYGGHISEEWYRSLLGEHIQKYRIKRLKESPGPTSIRGEMSVQNRIPGSKGKKIGSAERMVNGMENSAKYTPEINPLKNSNHYESDFTPDYGVDRFPSSLDNAYLDIGEGITYRIPPTYDKLAASLRLPNFSDIRVEDYYLKGTLDLGSLAAMMANERRFGYGRSGMADPQPQYKSLQAKLKALSTSKSAPKFSLQVCETGLDSSSIPEDAAGAIRRSIISEAGNLQVYYVKVLEKGDTYEIIERRLPKKQKVKKDPALIEKEEMDKIGKFWVTIARREIPRQHKIFSNFHRKQMTDAKRVSETCQREVKLKVSRSLKVMRGAAARTRKLARDMLVFWRKVDKEQVEVKKRLEKEEAEARKREQELREARRQQQRLDFLISQTELFNHFMQKKSMSQPSEALSMDDGELKGLEVQLSTSDDKKEEEDPEESEMKREALKVAQLAVLEQMKITRTFDNECSKLRQTAEPDVPPDEAPIAGSSSVDLLNPSTMPVTSSVQTPELFKGSLKEYQLKGLQWLVNCYEKGLNGILADEMGLGKTIQAMAFLAHLAEEKDIWGPFLVVAPASVLNNWADEISRFCPDLKTLPYWGGLQERIILRKNINPKRLYKRDAGFHILITSYQLLVSDEKYFRRVKWQYMVLDEAQAIKSASSIRWKTLLSFNCRNRLLLTGTPIQNNMAELWALLHFIMPTLFDSHEQFNEWFSKGIENHAEHGGTLNEHQLNRLHTVLKPFMLRRVKKDVITEMTGKTEVTVNCKLSSRQQAFYQAIKNKISLAELFDTSRGHLNEKKILNLMNIVIQLRKVCNHPELFERNEGSTYLYFGEIPNSLLPAPFGELEDVHYAGDQNPITYRMPKLVYQEFIQCPKMPTSTTGRGIHRELFEKRFNVFSPANIYASIRPQGRISDQRSFNGKTFEFSHLMDLSPEEVAFLAKGGLLERLLFSVMRWYRQFLDETLDFIMDEDENDDSGYNQPEKGKVRAVTRMLLMPSRSESNLLRRKLAECTGQDMYEALVVSHQDRLMANIRLLHSTYAFIPRTRAPPITAHCSDRNHAYNMIEGLHHPWIKRLLFGFARTSDCNGPTEPNSPHHLIQEIDSELPVTEPILQLTHKIFGSSPPLQTFDPAKMLTDSGKLQTLDILLKRLRAGNHRVLLFAQMTKMLNIIEDYMNYRKYKYLRLDGSSTIMDRRDMVRDFQRRNDIFVFLLSTRAGGLGINLTAADTVIFYESDWNPTLDLQAMDRAHRLGQTKEVTVYRLICKETVEEKILQRASQKNTVQQLVMTGGHVQGDLVAPEDVVSILFDEAEQRIRGLPLQGKDRQKKKPGTKGIRIDAEGVATFDDLTNITSNAAAADPVPVHDSGKSNKNKKRKANSDNPKRRGSKKPLPNADSVMGMNEHNTVDGFHDSPGTTIPQLPKIKKPRRPKKSVNDDLEPVLSAPNPVGQNPDSNPFMHVFSPDDFRAEAEETSPMNDSPTG